jgi:hypothetical protein
LRSGRVRAYNQRVEGPSGETGKRKRRTTSTERRIVVHRRRKVFLIILLLLAGLAYWAYCTYYSGRLILLQQASALEITRGCTFGPFYLDAGQACLYRYRVEVPATDGMWETKIELLDDHGRVIHPQTDFIITGARSLGASSDYARSGLLRLRLAGYYSLRFTQLNGSYAASSATPPVMTLTVRAGVIRGWVLWLPLVVILLLLALLLYFW